RLQSLDHLFVARLVARRAVRPQLVAKLLSKIAIDLCTLKLSNETQRVAELSQPMHARLDDIDAFFEPRRVEKPRHERPQLFRISRVDILAIQPFELLMVE